MTGHLESLRFKTRGSSIGYGRTGIHVRSAPDRFPVCYILNCIRSKCFVLIKACLCSIIAMIVSSHYNRGFQISRQVPESRQRLTMKIALQNDICQQPLLLIRLRNSYLIKIYPIREEHIIGTYRINLTVALLSSPGRITLSCINY